MNDVPILVCPCGKRLRAPGAVPGRVGRCPSCGGEMRVPEPDSEVGEPRSEPRPTQKKKKKKNQEKLSTAIWDGLVTPPVDPKGIRAGFLYPFWGAPGVALLVVLPPLLWITSVPFVTLVIAFTGDDTPFRMGALLALIPSSLGLAVVFGYSLLFLGRILAASALGEVPHPRSFSVWGAGSGPDSSAWSWGAFRRRPTGYIVATSI